VIGARPTSRRFSAWSSWRLTERSAAREDDSVSIAVSTLK
jgi:hypothetical protein